MKPSSRSLALPHLVRWWWLRPAGGRQVLLMALPLIVSTASWSVMHFVDRMFLLWHSTTAMAAAMPAGMLLFALACLPLGVASYVNTFVAQYEGAGRSERVGRCVWQGVWIGLGVAPLFLLSVPVAHWLFAAVGHSGELLAAESAYYRVLAFGAGAMVISTALAAFFTGRGEMRVVMVVDSSASLLNGLSRLRLDLRPLGLPRLGNRGSRLGDGGRPVGQGGRLRAAGAPFRLPRQVPDCLGPRPRSKPAEADSPLRRPQRAADGRRGRRLRHPAAPRGPARRRGHGRHHPGAQRQQPGLRAHAGDPCGSWLSA